MKKFDEDKVTKYALKKYGNTQLVWWFIEGARYQHKLNKKRKAKSK